jgi:hypothetical protein
MNSLHFGPNRIIIEVRRYGTNKIERHVSHNLVCTGAFNAAKARLFDENSGFAAANYIALSMNTDPPSADSTELSEEITYGGLSRAKAIYSTSGCGVGECILYKVFMATEPIGPIVKMGLFDSIIGGNLYFEASIDPITLGTLDQMTTSWDKIVIS